MPRYTGATITKEGELVNGDRNVVLSNKCTVVGDANMIYGDNCHVTGKGNIIYGLECTFNTGNSHLSADRKENKNTPSSRRRRSRSRSPPRASAVSTAPREEKKVRRRSPERKRMHRTTTTTRTTHSGIGPFLNAAFGTEPGGIFSSLFEAAGDRAIGAIRDSIQSPNGSLPLHQFNSLFSGLQFSSNPPSTGSSAHSLKVNGTDTKASSPASQCGICMDHAIKTAIYPCGHACMCIKCVNTLTNSPNPKCPKCRAEINEVKLVFVES